MIPIKKLSWIINNECNMRCIHCYPDSGIENKKPLTDDEFDRLLRSLSSVRFKRVFLSGGEPILDKQFFRYLDIAKKISDEVYLCSNGTLLTDELLEKLSNGGVKGIVVSLQAISDEKAEEIYRRPKIASTILDTIKRIKKYDFVLGIEMAILKQNYQTIDDLFDIVKSHGVKYLSFKRLMEIGRGGVNNVSLTPKENYDVLKKIVKLQQQNKEIEVNVHDPLYGTILADYYQNAQDENKEILQRNYSCRAGTRWIGLDPFGNVSPCPLLLYQDTIVGNVFENTLKNILENSVLMRQLQTISDTEKANCKYNSSCLGCRVASIAKTKNLFAKDPMCVHEDCVCPITSKM